MILSKFPSDLSLLSICRVQLCPPGFPTAGKLITILPRRRSNYTEDKGAQNLPARSSHTWSNIFVSRELYEFSNEFYFISDTAVLKAARVVIKCRHLLAPLSAATIMPHTETSATRKPFFFFFFFFFDRVSSCEHGETKRQVAGEDQDLTKGGRDNFNSFFST